jgi:hypothetical protein
MVNVEDIIKAMYEVQRRRYDKPAVLRCHPSVEYALHAHREAQHFGTTSGRFGDPEPIGTWPDGQSVSVPGMFDPRHGALGMALEIDQYLPVDVWRLCDADQTLLYDCREGTSAL